MQEVNCSVHYFLIVLPKGSLFLFEREGLYLGSPLVPLCRAKNLQELFAKLYSILEGDSQVVSWAAALPRAAVLYIHMETSLYDAADWQHVSYTSSYQLLHGAITVISTHFPILHLLSMKLFTSLFLLTLPSSHTASLPLKPCVSVIVNIRCVHECIAQQYRFLIQIQCCVSVTLLSN